MAKTRNLRAGAVNLPHIGRGVSGHSPLSGASGTSKFTTCFQPTSRTSLSEKPLSSMCCWSSLARPGDMERDKPSREARVNAAEVARRAADRVSKALTEMLANNRDIRTVLNDIAAGAYRRCL